MQSDGNVVASFDRRGQFIITGNSRGKVRLCIDKCVYVRVCMCVYVCHGHRHTHAHYVCMWAFCMCVFVWGGGAYMRLCTCVGRGMDIHVCLCVYGCASLSVSVCVLTCISIHVCYFTYLITVQLVSQMVIIEAATLQVSIHCLYHHSVCIHSTYIKETNGLYRTKLLLFCKLVSTTYFNSKATSTSATDYSCHIKVIEVVNQSYGIHIMPLVINCLGGDTHVY